MHEKLIHRSRKNLEASAEAARWTSDLAKGLEAQAREVGYDGRLSQDCLGELQTFLAGLLEAQHRDMAQRVDQRKGLHDLAKIHRERRDELTREVYGQLVELRGLIRGLLGKNMERELFGAGQKTPREPWELARVAHNVTVLLAHPKAQDDLCRGLANEALWAAAVEKMSAPLAELWRLLHELDAMERDERVAVDRLHEAKERLHRSQIQVFRVQESLLGLAGCEALAEDLRPSEPRRRRSRKDRTEAVATGQLVETVARKPEPVVENAPEGTPETLQTGSSPLKAVPDPPESVEAGASLGSSPGSASEPASHPVRKVLKWIQAVPHRVRRVPETPETTASEERAA